MRSADEVYSFVFRVSQCTLEINDWCLVGTFTFRTQERTSRDGYTRQLQNASKHLPRCTAILMVGSLALLLCIRHTSESCQPEGRLFGGRSFVVILSGPRENSPRVAQIQPRPLPSTSLHSLLTLSIKPTEFELKALLNKHINKTHDVIPQARHHSHHRKNLKSHSAIRWLYRVIGSEIQGS